MRVFLDTNVLASALGTRGLCSDVVRTVMEFHHLVISEKLLEELARVLRDKFGLPHDAIEDAMWLVRQDAECSEEDTEQYIPIQDPDDVPLLSAARRGRSDVFVTGDKELLKLGSLGTMRIMGPRQFWEEVRGRPSH